MRQAYDYWQDQPGSTLDDAGTHEPPRDSGGSTRARPSFVSSEERLIGHTHPRGGSMPAQCSASRSIARGHSPSCVRTTGATQVDDSPNPNGPHDTPRGHQAKVHLVRVQVAFTWHATQDTVLCPGLCLPLDHPLKRIVGGRFTARAGSPSTQTNQTSLTRPHVSPPRCTPHVRSTMAHRRTE